MHGGGLRALTSMGLRARKPAPLRLVSAVPGPQPKERLEVDNVSPSRLVLLHLV